MSKQRSDWEDSLKLLVSQPVLTARQKTCSVCSMHGTNQFCQINLEWTPEFTKYKHSKCPSEKWGDGW